ncbi:MAG: hypothetical protein PUE01_13715 [Clostridiaceae bacterium]|nr:hypothetical protein [Clostridiaceae bacterium]
MKIALLIILFIMIATNFYCFYKSRKYFKLVIGNDEESKKNYKSGMKYIKISVVVSFLICLTGTTAVILLKFVAK